MFTTMVNAQQRQMGWLSTAHRENVMTAVIEPRRTRTRQTTVARPQLRVVDPELGQIAHDHVMSNGRQTHVGDGTAISPRMHSGKQLNKTSDR